MSTTLNHKIGLGTVQFGIPYGISNTNGQTSPAEVSKILQYANENGITILDTASAYGNAEKILGENNISSFRIVSKYMSPTPGHTLVDQLQQSLRLLGKGSLHAYLAHRPGEILEDAKQWKSLKELQEKGLIKKIGFSLNTPDELAKLLDKNYMPDLIQVPYNYFDQRFEKLMRQLKDSGCEIHSRSAFLQGLFFKDTNKLSAYFDAVKPLISDIQLQTKNLSGALLRFVAERPFIDKVIIGVENVRQLKLNLQGMKVAEKLKVQDNNVPDSILIPSNWP